MHTCVWWRSCSILHLNFASWIVLFCKYILSWKYKVLIFSWNSKKVNLELIFGLIENHYFSENTKCYFFLKKYWFLIRRNMRSRLVKEINWELILDVTRTIYFFEKIKNAYFFLEKYQFPIKPNMSSQLTFFY